MKKLIELYIKQVYGETYLKNRPFAFYEFMKHLREKTIIYFELIDADYFIIDEFVLLDNLNWENYYYNIEIL